MYTTYLKSEHDVKFKSILDRSEPSWQVQIPQLLIPVISYAWFKIKQSSAVIYHGLFQLNYRATDYLSPFLFYAQWKVKESALCGDANPCHHTTSSAWIYIGNVNRGLATVPKYVGQWPCVWPLTFWTQNQYAST